jgi:hypothetical protein
MVSVESEASAKKTKYDSTLALGRYTPDPNYDVRLPSG